MRARSSSSSGRSAGAVIRLIAVLAGIHARTDARGSRLTVEPALPAWLPTLTLHNLRAGTGAVSLRIADATVQVLANTTGFEVRTPGPESEVVGAAMR